MEFSPKKMTPPAKVRKECNRCIVKILKLMVRCQKSDHISRTDRWLVVAEARELLLSLSQIPYHIGKWVHGGEALIQSLAREFIKTIVVSTRKLRHISRVTTSIESDIALFEKLLGNREAVVSAVLNSASLVTEGNGLPYKSQADAFALVISTVVREYLKTNQLQLTNVKAWLVMLLGRLWLACLPNDGPKRDQVHSSLITSLPTIMKDRHQEFYKNVELLMQPFETLEELAPIKVRPLFMGTPKLLDEDLLKVIDFSGLPNKFLHFLHLCIQNMNSVFLTPMGHDQSFTILSQSSNFVFSNTASPISCKSTEKASLKKSSRISSQAPSQIDFNRAPQVTSQELNESYPCQNSSSNIYCASPRRPIRASACISQNSSKFISGLTQKETKLQTSQVTSPASNEISSQISSQTPCKVPSQISREKAYLPQKESSQTLSQVDCISNNKMESMEPELSSSWPLIKRRKSLRLSQKTKDNKSSNVIIKYSQDSEIRNVVYVDFLKSLKKNVAETGENELTENPELSLKVINESECQTDELNKRNRELSSEIINENRNQIDELGKEKCELPLKVMNRNRSETKKTNSVEEQVKDNPATPDYKKGERDSPDPELSLFLENDDSNPSREVTPPLIKVDTSDDERITDSYQVNERNKDSTDYTNVISTNIYNKRSRQKKNSQKRKLEQILCEKNSDEKNKSSFVENTVETLSKMPDNDVKAGITQSQSCNMNENSVHTKDINEKDHFFHEIEIVNKSIDILSNIDFIKKQKPDKEDNLVNIYPSADHTEINHMNSEQTTKVNNEIQNRPENSFQNKYSINPCVVHICPYIQSESGKAFSCVNENTKTVSGNQESLSMQASNGNSMSSQLEESEQVIEKATSPLRKTLEEGESVESLSIESEEEYKKQYQEKEVANKGTVSSIWNGSQLEDNRFVPRTWRRLVKARLKRKENGKIEQRVDVLLIPPTGRHIRYPKMLQNYLKDHQYADVDHCRVFKVSPRTKKKAITGSEHFMKGSPLVNKKKFKWIKNENKKHKSKVLRENNDNSNQGYCNVIPSSDNDSNSLIIQESQRKKSFSSNLLDQKITGVKILSQDNKQNINSVYDFTDEMSGTLHDKENLAVSSKINDLKPSNLIYSQNGKSKEKDTNNTEQTKELLTNHDNVKSFSVSNYNCKNMHSSNTHCTDLESNVTPNKNLNTNKNVIQSGNCSFRDESATFDHSESDLSSIKHKKRKQFPEEIPGSIIAANCSSPGSIYGTENSVDITPVTSPLKTPRLSNNEIVNHNALKHLTSTPAFSLQDETKNASQLGFITTKGKAFQNQHLEKNAEITNIGTKHESDDINSCLDSRPIPVFMNVSNTSTQTLSVYNHIDSNDISGCLTVIRDSQTGSRLALLPLSEQTVGDDIRIEISVRRYPKKPIKSAQMLNSSVFTLSPNDIVPPTLLETEGGTVVSPTPMKMCGDSITNPQQQKSSCQRNLFMEFEAQDSSATKSEKHELEEQSNKIENNSELQTDNLSNEKEDSSMNDLEDTGLKKANHSNKNEVSPSNEFSDIYLSLTNSVKQCFLSPSSVDDPFSPIMEPIPNVSKTLASVSSKKFNNIEIDSDSQSSMSSNSNSAFSESCGSYTSNNSKGTSSNKYKKTSCASRILKNIRLASHFPGLNQRLSSPSKKFQSGLCFHHCRSRKTLKNPKLCDPCCPLCVMTLDEQVLCTYQLDTSYLSGAEVDQDSPIMDFVSAKQYLYGEYSNIMCTVFPSMSETSLLPEFGAPPAACRKHAVTITGASEEIIDGIPRFTTSFSDVSRDIYSLNENTSCGLSSQEFMNSQLQQNNSTSPNSLENLQTRKNCLKSRNDFSKISIAASSTSCSDVEEISSSTKEKLKHTKRRSKSKFNHTTVNKQIEPHKSKQKIVKYKAVLSSQVSSSRLHHLQSKKISENKLSPKVPDINNRFIVHKQNLSPKVSNINTNAIVQNLSPKFSSINSNFIVQNLSPKVSNIKSNVIVQNLSPKVSSINSNFIVQNLSTKVSNIKSNVIVQNLSPKVSIINNNVIVHNQNLSPTISNKNSSLIVHKQKLTPKIFSQVDVKKDCISSKICDDSNLSLSISTPDIGIPPDRFCNLHDKTNKKKENNEIFKKENSQQKKIISTQKITVAPQEVNTSQQSFRLIDQEKATTPSKESKTPKKFFKTPRKFRKNLNSNDNTYKMYKHYIIGNNKTFSPLKLSFKYVSPKRESFDSFERFKKRLMSGKKKQSPRAMCDKEDAHLYL